MLLLHKGEAMERQMIHLTFRDYVSGSIALGVVIVLFYWFLQSGITHEDDDGIEYYTILHTSYGVSEGSNIFFLDIPIGKVESVSLTDTTEGKKVKVEFVVLKRYRDIMRRDSTLEINSPLQFSSLILNSTGINVVMGKESTYLNEGDMVLTRSVKNITTGMIFDAINNVSEIIHKLNDPQGDFQQTLLHMNNFSNALDKEPFAQKLIGKTEFERMRQSLTSASHALAEAIPALTAELNNTFAHYNEGAEGFKKIVTENRKTIRAAFMDFNATAHEAHQTVKEIHKEANITALLIDTQELIDDTDVLINKLRTSWILGSDGNHSSQTPEMLNIK